MSYTRLYGIRADGALCRLVDFENGWRSAPMLWTHLLMRLGVARRGDSMMPLWPRLWEDASIDARLSDTEWWALAATFDRHVVASACASDLVTALRAVQGDIIATCQEGAAVSPTLGAQADAIEHALREDPTWRGFAWNQTSVSSTWSGTPNLDLVGDYHLVTGLRRVEYVEPQGDGEHHRE